jgi:hypothetical protein
MRVQFSRDGWNFYLTERASNGETVTYRVYNVQTETGSRTHKQSADNPSKTMCGLHILDTGSASTRPLTCGKCLVAMQLLAVGAR